MNSKCEKCKEQGSLGFDISMAFQPIVNLNTFEISAYEALVRGTNNESAGEIFTKVNKDNLYLFDQSCRTKAIELAARLNLDVSLSINFMPNAVYEPSRCIQSTLQAAKKYNFPLDSLIFEFTEQEKVRDNGHLAKIVSDYQKRGFLTTIDDFGAGFSGLAQLAELSVDIVKVDRALIKDIDQDPRKQLILKHLYNLLTSTVERIVVEGVETSEELKVLYAIGFRYFQGYYFAKPGFECLPRVDFDNVKRVVDSNLIT